MQFDEAVLLSIKKFKEGKMLNNTSEVKDGEIYYTPEYFDGLQEALNNDVEVEDKELDQDGDTTEV